VDFLQRKRATSGRRKTRPEEVRTGGSRKIGNKKIERGKRCKGKNPRKRIKKKEGGWKKGHNNNHEGEKRKFAKKKSEKRSHPLSTLVERRKQTKQTGRRKNLEEKSGV